MTLTAFQDSKAATARSTSTSAAATPACTEAGALRGRGRPCMAASLCCWSATTSSVQRATSAAVLQEQQVRTDFVKGIQGAQGQMGGGHRRTGIVSSFILLKNGA